MVTNRVCQTGANVCVECNTDAQCTDNPTDKKCDTASHTCVECLTMADLGGDEPICNTSSHRCQVCTAAPDPNAACVARMAGTVCVSSGASSASASAATRSTTTAAAAPTTSALTAPSPVWTASARRGCGSSNTVCLTGGDECVECNTDAQCTDEVTDKHCNPGTHTCVACVDDGDCSGSTPTLQRHDAPLHFVRGGWRERRGAGCGVCRGNLGNAFVNGGPTNAGSAQLAIRTTTTVARG